MKKALTISLIISFLVIGPIMMNGNAFADNSSLGNNKVVISAGSNYVFAIKEDGTIWAWGANNYGQLGDGTLIDQRTPVEITNIGDVIDIAAGSVHTLALKSDGTVWVCGTNNYGQYGNGQNGGESKNKIWVRWGKDFTDAIAIASSEKNSFVVKKDGTVWSCGYNTYGQLGYGDSELHNSLVPCQVVGLTDVIDIAAGDSFAIALKKDGTVWAWGDFDGSQLETGEAWVSGNNYGGLDFYSHTRIVNFKNRPVQIDGLNNIISITSGASHSLALRSDGSVWSWGQNQNGQLGNGMYRADKQAYQIGGLSDIIAVAAGYNQSEALTKDGSVWTWGGNKAGQLGDGTTMESTKPVRLTDLTGIVKIAAGGSEDIRAYTMALKKDGTLQAWGYDLSCQPWNTTGLRVLKPAAVKGLTLFPDKEKEELSLPYLSNITVNGVSSWAEDSAKLVKYYGLAEDDFFSRPKDPVKRSEFAVLAVKTCEKVTGNAVNAPISYYFSDIADCKYKDYIQQAYELGIVKGSGKFYNPDKYISRQEICCIILNLIEAIYPGRNYKTDDDITFSDDSDIASWARNAVVYSYKNKIMNGTGNNRISPLENTTMEQAFTLICNVIKYK